MTYNHLGDYPTRDGLGNVIIAYPGDTDHTNDIPVRDGLGHVILGPQDALPPVGPYGSYSYIGGRNGAYVQSPLTNLKA